MPMSNDDDYDHANVKFINIDRLRPKFANFTKVF